MSMKARAVISTPFPSLRTVASEMGVPKPRVLRLTKLMNEIIDTTERGAAKKKRRAKRITTALRRTSTKR
jgi:hypothetical protein